MDFQLKISRWYNCSRAPAHLLQAKEGGMASETTAGSDESLKLAIAIALLRSKVLKKHSETPHPPSATSSSDAIKWKRKAKERKQEIFRLKKNLEEVEDGLHHELFTGSASCKCYFFENLGKLNPNQLSGEGCDGRFNDVLRRRFLRQVRLKERRKRRSEGSSFTQGSFWSEHNDEEIEQLRASVDFLVELCDTISSPDDANFANWSHQAVDFILDAIKNILSKGTSIEHVEGIVGSLSLRLVKKMCTTSQGNAHNQFETNPQFHVQHLLRKLGSESCVGQQVILAVSQRISLLSENLLFLDPFDSAFFEMHTSLYILIQLIEFLVSDNLISWSKTDGFASELLEEWVTSILHARKGLQLLESRCGLYILYMDRVIGLIAKLVAQIASLHNLNPNILRTLLC
ncbi:protein MULTIPOLAR SPINDLE 1 isoform X2 [Lactuca sativa]|uniref:protein MULTIPOLAR SPINDLE 1 isoform X2 n=1 Tax=Lactuca sativa TaxID=4236 RepID=UPI000CD8839D|nr:protein MULTIPOLAR SPINDLE 1 isoform X2 [Lactuca sativa]